MKKVIMSLETKNFMSKHGLVLDKSRAEIKIENNSSFPQTISKSIGTVFRYGKKNDVVYIHDLGLFIPFRNPSENPHTEEAVKTQDWSKFDESDKFIVYPNEYNTCVILNKDLNKLDKFNALINKFYSRYKFAFNKGKKKIYYGNVGKIVEFIGGNVIPEELLNKATDDIKINVIISAYASKSGKPNPFEMVEIALN